MVPAGPSPHHILKPRTPEAVPQTLVSVFLITTTAITVITVFVIVIAPLVIANHHCYQCCSNFARIISNVDTSIRTIAIDACILAMVIATAVAVLDAHPRAYSP